MYHNQVDPQQLNGGESGEAQINGRHERRHQRHHINRQLLKINIYLYIKLILYVCLIDIVYLKL